MPLTSIWFFCVVVRQVGLGDELPAQPGSPQDEDYLKKLHHVLLEVKAKLRQIHLFFNSWLQNYTKKLNHSFTKERKNKHLKQSKNRSNKIRIDVFFFFPSRFQVEIVEGSLICPETGREFPIINGIPNMLLNEDEV